MLKTTSRIAALLALFFCVTFLRAADPVNEMKLQQAIDLLESKGDLSRATPLFEQVSRSSDRALASRALLYLGGIRERQGREAARSIYDRILREFSNQHAAVEARKRLTALGVMPTDDLALSRLVAWSFDENDSSLSSDGLSIAGPDLYISGDIVVQDVATGRLRRMLAKPVVENDPWDEWGSWASFSRDQSQVLFSWTSTKGSGMSYELRVMANKPGSPGRVLLKTNEEIRYFNNGAWFPDGRSVLIQAGTRNGEWQLVRVGVADKSFQTITSLQWRLQGVRGRPSISPDGKYIAYAALANNPTTRPRNFPDPATPPGFTDQYIYVLPADGAGSESVVARSTGINEGPVWSPDGSHVLFISDRSIGPRTGIFGLWSI